MSQALKYTKEKRVGEGTFAVIYVGRNIETSQQVALKMIKVSEFKDGLDMSAIREVRFLQEMQHANVINLYDVFAADGNLTLVLEYAPADLEMLIKDRAIFFSEAHIKSWLLMLLRGVHHCFRNFIIHRDLKPSNLLIAPNGVLKIADFGLARHMALSPNEKLTNSVVTRWYRAPELLLGARHYSGAVDVWSVGAIFAELMLRVPFLPGKDDYDQIDVTFRALGSPTRTSWPGVENLPGFASLGTSYPENSKFQLHELFSAASDAALELMYSMLELDPNKRATATGALLSRYFTDAPSPTKPEDLPKKSS